MATTRLDKKNQTYDESVYLNLQCKDLIWKFGKKKKSQIQVYIPTYL